MSETKKSKAYDHGPTLKDKLVEIKEKHGIHAVAEALMSPLGRIAQEFSSGTRLGPGFGSFSPFTKMDSKTIGFMGIEYLTDHMNKYDWPLAPEIGFRGLKHAKMGDDNSVKEAMAIFGVKSLSPSGINVEFEVPMAIRNGGFLEPSVMMIQGTPRIICQAEIDILMDRCTFNEPMDIRGGMFTPPLEQEVRESLLSLRDEVGDMPHVNRGMFYIADKKAQAVSETDIDKVINLRQQGMDLNMIAEELDMDFEIVQQIWEEYQQEMIRAMRKTKQNAE